MGAHRVPTWAWWFVLPLIGASPAASRGERIDFQGPFVNGLPVTSVVQGQSFSLLARLTANNEIPLFGYSLNVDVSSETGATGSVAGNASLSDFYVQQNLITQGGGQLHPLLSIIIEPGDGGLFVNGVNHEAVPVNLAVPGVNDILAELVFQTTPATLGTFDFTLGPGSVLSHVPKVELPFDVIPKKVEVIPIPEPATFVALTTLVAMASCSRRGSKRYLGARSDVMAARLEPRRGE